MNQNKSLPEEGEIYEFLENEFTSDYSKRLKHLYSLLYYLKKQKDEGMTYNRKKAVKKTIKEAPPETNAIPTITAAITDKRYLDWSTHKKFDPIFKNEEYEKIIDRIDEKFNLVGDDKKLFENLLDIEKDSNKPSGSDLNKNLKVDFEENKPEKIDNLHFTDEQLIIDRVHNSLKNGKHLILVGPPGTGKSKLAKAICKSYRDSKDQWKMSTATSDWTTFDTIGGYRMKKENKELEFRPGIFLDCFKNKSLSEDSREVSSGKLPNDLPEKGEIYDFLDENLQGDYKKEKMLKHLYSFLYYLRKQREKGESYNGTKALKKTAEEAGIAGPPFYAIGRVLDWEKKKDFDPVYKNGEYSKILNRIVESVDLEHHDRKLFDPLLEIKDEYEEKKSLDPNEANYPQNTWLILDEINRADIDKAFGSLFSALTGDNIDLPYKEGNDEQNNEENYIEVIGKPSKKIEEYDLESKYIIPEDWRIIATMNTFDKTSLYTMSYAFMRRFAFIYVGVPKIPNEEDSRKELIDEYIKCWEEIKEGEADENLKKDTLKIWQSINKIREIGPAIVKDIFTYLLSNPDDYEGALIQFVYPQFEGVSKDEHEKFLRQIKNHFSEEDIVADSLVEFVDDFFGIKCQIDEE